MTLVRCPICGVEKWRHSWHAKRPCCARCQRLITLAHSTPCCAEHRKRNVTMLEGVLHSQCTSCERRSRLIMNDKQSETAD